MTATCVVNGREHALEPDETVERLLERLEEVRRRGFSIDEGENEEGLTGVAAPVRSASGDVQAALVVAGPGTRILDGGSARWADAVVAAANDISASLGYRPAEA